MKSYRFVALKEKTVYKKKTIYLFYFILFIQETAVFCWFKKKITNECVVRHATGNAINDRLFTFKLHIHRTQHRAAASTSSSQYRIAFSFTENKKKKNQFIFWITFTMKSAAICTYSVTRVYTLIVRNIILRFSKKIVFIHKKTRLK